ncbi:hypothetical protein P167DRAFT_606057 [Morchella conica CCBAS932]|uniref:Uncharacterized protein n=1 Tax=Morchella conica CCBAS932 TaxID=1392247 RepID=A0A3N4KU77_9PEZI|nr:hypothetical protein P167DRAFT_606057 [Morchella conica CCBAS932]
MSQHIPAHHNTSAPPMYLHPHPIDTSPDILHHLPSTKPSHPPLQPSSTTPNPHKNAHRHPPPRPHRPPPHPRHKMAPPRIPHPGRTPDRRRHGPRNQLRTRARGAPPARLRRHEYNHNPPQNPHSTHNNSQKATAGSRGVSRGAARRGVGVCRPGRGGAGERRVGGCGAGGR